MIAFAMMSQISQILGQDLNKEITEVVNSARRRLQEFVNEAI